MSYLLTINDPKPNKSDAFISTQVKMIAAKSITVEAHQLAVNAFLVSLRESTTHVAAIRSVNMNLIAMKNTGDIDAVTTIHYLLVGNTDAPYIH